MHEDLRSQAEELLQRWGGPAVDVGQALCDKWAADPDRVALYYEDVSGQEVRLTYRELEDRSRRFATVLRELGVEKGDRVATLVPKRPELVITLLALWRLGAVQVPLFTAFGPQAIAYRVAHSGAKAIVTVGDYRPNVTVAWADPSFDTAAARPLVITVDTEKGNADPGDVNFWSAVSAAVPMGNSVLVAGDDLLYLLYTSGTTGSPKGVPYPVQCLAFLEAYARFGLDLRPEDNFWNMADPGWGYGLGAGVIVSLLLGKSNLFYNAPFNPEAIVRMLVKYQVTNFASAPTVFRGMRAAEISPELMGQVRLRAISSAGEPLNAELISWAQENLGVPIHDHFGQSESGMLLNNHHAPELRRPVRPGSMGHASPGYRVVILDPSHCEVGPGVVGEMALDIANSPLLLFRGFYNDPARSAEKFSADGRYYRSGDAMYRDEDGYFFFSSRADDVILTAGYRVGPFEVESALMGHPAVVEAAVIGVPDALRLQAVKAFVILKAGYEGTEELSSELTLFVKSHLARHAYPREIEFVQELPKTPSGKVQRFLLRSR